MELYLGEEGWMRQRVWGFWPVRAPNSLGAEEDRDEMYWSTRTFHIDSTACSVVLFRGESTVLISDGNSDVPHFPRVH